MKNMQCFCTHAKIANAIANANANCNCKQKHAKTCNEKLKTQIKM